MWSSSNGVSGFEWFIVVLAFLIDLGAYAQGGRRAGAEPPSLSGAPRRPGKASLMCALASTMKSRRSTSPPSSGVISTSTSGMKAMSIRLNESESRLW